MRETPSLFRASKIHDMRSVFSHSVWLRLQPGMRFFGRGLVLGLLPCAARAQMHHVEAPARVTRAVGVYEWTGELAKPTAARFVPVSLFINGHMEDAGLYLARPVPFALQTGDIYALEHAGELEGLLDLDYAERVVTGQALADDDPAGAWYGFGKFTPEAAPKEAPALHASSHPPVILADGKAETAPADDGQPHMARRGAAATPGATKSGSTTGTAGEAGKSTGDSSQSSSDDTDRPTLRHRDPSQDATRRREYGTRSKQASVVAVGPAPGDDPDRPVLGRSDAGDKGTPPLTGLPADLHQAVAVSDPVQRDHHDFAREWDSPAERTQTLAALEAAARSRVLTYLAANRLVANRGPLPAENTTSQSETAEKATGTSPAAKPIAAPQDDGDADDAAHPKLQRGVPSQYKRDTAAPVLIGAGGIAAVTAQPSGKLPGVPSAAAAPPAKKTASTSAGVAARSRVHGSKQAVAPIAPLTLARQQIAGFSLSYGGLPTFVYTAAASVSTIGTLAPAIRVVPGADKGGIPSAPAPRAAATSSPSVVYVTVVAQRLPSGDLQVVLSNVTDSHHLDRNARFRLVDAVDPDDSHRASLLFELRGASSRQFALYRLTSEQAEQTFTTAAIE